MVRPEGGGIVRCPFRLGLGFQVALQPLLCPQQRVLGPHHGKGSSDRGILYPLLYQPKQMTSGQYLGCDTGSGSVLSPWGPILRRCLGPAQDR